MHQLPQSKKARATHCFYSRYAAHRSSRRFLRICVKACRAHMRIRALASAGRVHVKLDRRFRHVCPFLVYRLPRKCCTCQIRPSFSTCSHFSGVSRRDQVFHTLHPPHLVRQMLTVLQIKHPPLVKSKQSTCCDVPIEQPRFEASFMEARVKTHRVLRGLLDRQEL